MIFLRSIELKQQERKDEFPFNLPILRNLSRMELDTPVTFFVGENGSGKSTLLEAIAIALNATAVGSDRLATDESLDQVRDLSGQLRLARNRNPIKKKEVKRGFFFRAEDFFGFIKKIKADINDFKAMETDYDENYTGNAREIGMDAARSQYMALLQSYGKNPDGFSHGEAFLKLFESRLVPEGLYILDEPETPLSPQFQLAFLSILKRMVKESCQFIIATHSPMIMAFPDAKIYVFGEDGPQEACYEDVEHVSLTRSFLSDPENFLRRL